MSGYQFRFNPRFQLKLLTRYLAVSYYFNLNWEHAGDFFFCSEDTSKDSIACWLGTGLVCAQVRAFNLDPLLPKLAPEPLGYSLQSSSGMLPEEIVDLGLLCFCKTFWVRLETVLSKVFQPAVFLLSGDTPVRNCLQLLPTPTQKQFLQGDLVSQFYQECHAV